MKIFIIFLSALALFSFPGVILVQGQGIQQQDRIQDQTSQPTALQENQNRIQVQNQGEETQLRTSTQYMQELMNMEGLDEEVGKQIKKLAQQQIQAQSEIQTQLNKLEAKSRFMKSLFGPDYKAIKNLNQQVEQNRFRIQQLTQLADQVQNQTEETQLQEAIQALTQQNTALQEQVRAEEKVGSLLGWLVKLFVN
jgi:hypothetical protein